MKMKIGKWTVGVGCAATMLLVAGCALFGTNAKDPGRYEEGLFNRTNVPMVTVHSFTNVVTVTNTVPQYQTNVVTVNRTNEVGVVVPTFTTNTVTNFVQQVKQEERVTPAGTTVLVPQLVGRTAAGDAVISTGSGIANLWGLGPLVGLALSGGFNWYQNARNRALAAKYTGATQGQNVANQASAALVQNVETLLEVLQQTPQGQAALPAVKKYLMDHQLETGTISTIAQYIDANVDNQAARESAAEILKGLTTLKA